MKTSIAMVLVLVMEALDRLAHGADFNAVVEQTGVTVRVSEALGLIRSVKMDERDWQLYDRPGEDRASRDLDKALREVGAAMHRLGLVMGQYDDYGALDTEPRYVARAAIRDIAEAVL